MAVTAPWEFAKALVEAGVMTQEEISKTRRIVIDCQHDRTVMLYTERYGDDSIIRLVPLLRDLLPDPEPGETVIHVKPGEPVTVPTYVTHARFVFDPPDPDPESPDVRPALQARFDALQRRDGFPDPQTGQSHCEDCHGLCSPDGPRCGHYAGCPEC